MDVFQTKTNLTRQRAKPFGENVSVVSRRTGRQTNWDLYEFFTKASFSAVSDMRTFSKNVSTLGSRQLAAKLLKRSH